MRLRALVALPLVLAVLGLAGCGDDTDSGDDGAVQQLEVDFLPDRVLGLEVEQEDMVEAITSSPRQYVDAVGLYSFRREDVLQATLQVGRFSDDADYRSSRFQRAIVNHPSVASTPPRAYRMGDQTVWLTTGKSQRVTVWFAEDRFFVLAVRDDFGRGRSLLRETVELAA